MSLAGKYKAFSDSELIAAVKAGDERAFDALFLRWYPQVRKFLLILVKNKALAEDLAQTVFMKVWLYRDRLDPAKSLKNYLLVLSKNSALDVFKSERPDQPARFLRDHHLYEGRPSRRHPDRRQKRLPVPAGRMDHPHDQEFVLDPAPECDGQSDGSQRFLVGKLELPRVQSAEKSARDALRGRCGGILRLFRHLH